MAASLQQFEVHLFSALDELRGYLAPHEAVDYLIRAIIYLAQQTGVVYDGTLLSVKGAFGYDYPSSKPRRLDCKRGL